MINPEESLLQIYDIACFSLNQIAHGKAMDCFVLRGDLTTQRGFLAGGGGTSTTALFSFGDGSFNFLSAQRKRKKKAAWRYLLKHAKKPLSSQHCLL